MRDERTPLIKKEDDDDNGTTTSNALSPQTEQEEAAGPEPSTPSDTSSKGTKAIIMVLILGTIRPAFLNVFSVIPAQSANAVVMIGVFVANADGNFLITVYGQIASEFNHFSNAGWLLLMYPLATCATQTLYGKLSDIYGRKSSVLAAYVLFLVGLGLCGFASTFWVLMVGRAVSGIGGAGIVPLTAIIITDIMPRRHVASWRGYTNIAVTTGRALGGPVGGFLADTIGWRWSFLAQCPVVLLAIALVAWKLPSTGRFGAQQRTISRLKRIDFVGSILLAATITCSLLALNAGLTLPWNAPVPWVLGGTSLVLGILFLIIEAYFASEPILPLRLLRHWNIVASYIIIFLQTFSQLAIICSVPLYFQLTENVSASVSGLYLLPAVAGNCVAGVAAGILVRVTGRYYSITMTGLLSAAIGTLLLILRWHRHTSIGESMYISLCGAGYGIVLTTVYIVTTIGIDISDTAIAGAGFYQCLSIGWVSGVGIATAVLQATLRPALSRGLDGIPGKQRIIEQSLSDIGYVQSLKGHVHVVVINAYVRSIKYTHVLSLVCSCLSVLVALFLPKLEL